MHANVGIFSLSYAIIPSFLVSVLFIDPYFIFKFNILARVHNLLLLCTLDTSLFSFLVIACIKLCNECFATVLCDCCIRGEFNSRLHDARVGRGRCLVSRRNVAEGSRTK